MGPSIQPHPASSVTGSTTPGAGNYRSNSLTNSGTYPGGLTPGSKDPIKFTETIFEMVNPKVVVFSVGDNHKNHPRGEIIKKIMNLDNSCAMLSTGDASALLEIIENNAGCNHKNKLGNIKFRLDRDPIEY